MTRAAVLIAALLVTGCAGREPAVRVETVRVLVPVACVEPADVPAQPAPLGKRPADARAALDIALAKLVELMGPGLDGAGGYVGRADALLSGCTKKNARLDR